MTDSDKKADGIPGCILTLIVPTRMLVKNGGILDALITFPGPGKSNGDQSTEKKMSITR